MSAPLSCPLCGKVFTEMSDLQVHMRDEHNAPVKVYGSDVYVEPSPANWAEWLAEREKAMKGKIEEIPTFLDKQYTITNTLALATYGLTVAGSSIPFIDNADAIDEIWRLPYLQAMVNQAVDYQLSQYNNVLKPLLQRLQYRTYMPVLPDPGVLARLASKALLKDEDYFNAMAEHGLKKEWAAVCKSGQYVPPRFDELAELKWRGLISDVMFKAYLQLSNVFPDLLGPLLKLTEMIPPAADLVTMVVREAFVPEMVTPAPDVFAKYMAMKGFGKEWSDRYWTMHWTPIELRQAYENLWRGLWTKDQFMRALHIADIHPMWREDIFNVAFGPPGVRELGYGYDTGLYSIEDIVKYRRWGGLSPEDAEKAGRAMVAYRTEAEREALRREALYDFTEGLDSEEELRANLEAIGGRSEIIDLWVARAKFRAGRDAMVQEIGFWRDAAIRGLVTQEELENTLAAMGVQRWKIEQIRKYVSIRRSADPEVVKLLTPAQIGRLYKLGRVTREYAHKRLTAQGYDPEEANLFLMLYEESEAAA